MFGIFGRKLVEELRSEEAEGEIRRQIMKVLTSELAPQVDDFKAQIASEGRITGQRLSYDVTSALNREADRLRNEMAAQMRAYLCSSEGRELLIELTIEALSEEELAKLISDAEARVKEIAAANKVKLKAIASDAENRLREAETDVGLELNDLICNAEVRLRDAMSDAEMRLKGIGADADIWAAALSSDAESAIAAAAERKRAELIYEMREFNRLADERIIRFSDEVLSAAQGKLQSEIVRLIQLEVTAAINEELLRQRIHASPTRKRPRSHQDDDDG